MFVSSFWWQVSGIKFLEASVWYLVSGVGCLLMDTHNNHFIMNLIKKTQMLRKDFKTVRILWKTHLTLSTKNCSQKVKNKKNENTLHNITLEKRKLILKP